MENEVDQNQAGTPVAEGGLEPEGFTPTASAEDAQQMAELERRMAEELGIPAELSPEEELAQDARAQEVQADSPGGQQKDIGYDSLTKSGKPRRPGQFKAGRGLARDPRINAHGRPKTHDQLRHLIQQIAGEELAGTNWSQLENMLRTMFKSKNPIDHTQILEHGWGKVKTEVEFDFTRMTDAQLERFIATRAGGAGVSDSGSATAGDLRLPPSTNQIIDQE